MRSTLLSIRVVRMELLREECAKGAHEGFFDVVDVFTKHSSLYEDSVCEEVEEGLLGGFRGF